MTGQRRNAFDESSSFVWFKRRIDIRVVRLFLLCLHGTIVVLLIYLYLFPPPWSKAWVSWFIQLAPWMSSLAVIQTRAVVGDRLAFVLAFAYVPGIFLSCVTAFAEIKAKRLSVKKGVVRGAVCVLFTAAVVVTLHKLIYGQVSIWPMRIEIMQPIMAFITPWMMGFFVALCVAVVHSTAISFVRERV